MLGRDIRELVIVKLEEHTPFGDMSGETLLAGGDILSEVKPVYSYIDASMQEGADEALRVIPIGRLKNIAIDAINRPHAGLKYIIVSENTYYRATELDTAFRDDSVPVSLGIGRELLLRGWSGTAGNLYTLSSAPAVGAQCVTLSGDTMTEAGEVSATGTMTANSVAIADANDSLIGTIAKPSDMLRLHTLQMQDWRRPVHAVIHPDDPLYVQQFNRWQRGTAQKPVVVDDGIDLHYYSQQKAADSGIISTFLYVPHFDENTDYPLDVAEVIAISVAGKVLEIFSMKEQLELLTKEMESVISVMKL